MGAKTKTWSQKWDEALRKPGFPKVFDCDKSGKKFVVPAPAEVEAYIRAIPPGSVVPIGKMADALAQRHKVEICCPMTTGIFAWILAHAAREAKDVGIPWWRVVKTTGELNVKYPGAPDLQKALLEQEGHTIVAKGSRWFVKVAEPAKELAGIA